MNMYAVLFSKVKYPYKVGLVLTNDKTIKTSYL